MHTRKYTILAAILIVIANFSKAQYPFELPVSFTAEIDIDTKSKEKFNNLLLGTNIFNFIKPEDKELVRFYNPITIRFPHGLFSNWYDWELDKARVFGTETFTYRKADGNYAQKTIDHLPGIQVMDKKDMYVGFNALEILNKEKTGGYDMLWTFNMSADGADFDNNSPTTLARYRNLKRRGFQVKAIELGNENFYPGQRSSIIPNTEDYLRRAKSMSAALKAEDPNIQLSIPLLRRENYANPNWNSDLTADQTYFDAVTVHTYIGSNPDEVNSGAGAYADALTAREGLRKSVDDYAGKVAPAKPVWLSEWGVNSGGANAVSALGMADCYIFMSENQHRYQRANWFSVNGKLNSFLVWEKITSANGIQRPKIKQPIEKNVFGITYEIVRSVFENATLLGSSVNSPELIHGVKAVSARAILKNGKTTLFVLNLTDKEVPFTIKINGKKYKSSFVHNTMSFSKMSDEKTLPLETKALTTLQQGKILTLPKFSINTILLNETKLK